MVAADQRHRGARKCPVCGGRDDDPRGQGLRCSGYTSDDGKWVHCSRDDRAGALEANEHGLFVHLHTARTPCRCGTTHAAMPVATGTRIDAVRRHVYRDEAGAELYEVLKMADGTYRQRRALPGGQHEWKLGDVRRVLYRLPELLAADPDEPVYICEGERDADTLAAQGLVSTTNPGGAGKWSTVQRHAGEVLMGRTVVVVADRDGESARYAGQRHASAVVKALTPHVRTIRAVMPPKHKDVAEHLGAGGTLATLVPLEVPGGVALPLTDDRPTAPPVDNAAPPEPKAAPVLRLVPRTEDVREDVTITPDAHELDATIARLLAKCPDLYERGGALCHVILDEHGTSHRIREAPDSYLVNRASSMARFVVDAGDAGMKQVPPPEVRVRSAGALGSWPGVRKLERVSCDPVIRPDGTIAMANGYDAATRTYVHVAYAVPRIPVAPTQSDAVLAYKALADVFVDFPYENPAYVSAVVACVLTLLGRSMYRGATPCWVFEASSPRSGKSLQLDLVSILGLGEIASRASYPSNPEELEKVIGAYALKGASLIPFDNVTGKFGGAALDMAITAEDSIETRILGKSETSKIPWRGVIIATGNNIEMRGDMLPRVLCPRLEPKCENPELRTGFRHGNDGEIRQWAMANRPALVSHALTILSSYHVAGRPKVAMPSWGGFTQWAASIAAPLVWLGAPSPMLARRGLENDGDPRREMANDLAAGLEQLLRDLDLKDATAQQIVDAVFPAPRADEGPDPYATLRGAICDACPDVKPGFKPSSNRIGVALGKFKGVIVNGRRLMKRVIDGKGLWRVERMQ